MIARSARGRSRSTSVRIPAVAALAFAAAAVAAHGAEGPPAPADDEFARLEDEADALEPELQLERYLVLRRRVLESGEGGRKAVLERLAMKLRLADERARGAQSDFATRLSFCRQAAAIGEMHLGANDPRRALAWQEICSRIEPRNDYGGVLRNKVHEEFERRLAAGLESRAWGHARAALDEWAALIGDDPAVREGRLEYARSRARDLAASLDERGAAATIEDLERERALVGAAEAWDDLRRRAARSVQDAFDRAIADRRAAEAAAQLDRQRGLAARFALETDVAPLEANRGRLDDLRAVLAPPPFQQAGGHVAHTAFRMAIADTDGIARFTDRGEELADAVPGFDAALRFRGRATEGSRWYGAEVTVWSVGARRDLSTAAATIVGAHALAGTRGRRHAAHAGVGIMYADIEFLGSLVADRGSGFVVGALAAGVERALGESFVLAADAELAWSEPLARSRATLTLAWLPNRNFALGLRASAVALRVADESTGMDIDARAMVAGWMVGVRF